MNDKISFEVRCGVVIALFAALMSISDLFGVHCRYFFHPSFVSCSLR